MLCAIFGPAALLATALFAAGYQCAHLRITNGHDAVPHSSPWIVSIQASDLQHQCGGSIINASWVVTAAHCTFGDFPFVVAGLYDLGEDESATRQQRTINYTRVYRHPNGQPPPNPGPNDIALIHIDPPFEFDADVRPIELPPADRIPSGEATLFGWGSTSKSEWPIYPNILQTVEMQILPYAECLKIIPGLMVPTMLCTGPLNEGISACFGDSGGPLIQAAQLVGITEFVYSPCGSEGWPSGFTRTSAFVDWIAQVQRDDK